MRQLKNKLIALGVLGMLAVIGSVMSRQAVAQGPSNGLAVRIVGGDVAISGTPNVYVNNMSTNPLWVRDADGEGRIPFEASDVGVIPDGMAFLNSTPSPKLFPAGYRLVIDHFTVYGEMPLGQKLLGVNLFGFVGSSADRVWFGMQSHEASPGGGFFHVAPATISSGEFEPHMPVDSKPNNFLFSAVRNSTVGEAKVQLTYRGHLIKIP